jgi:hypothetical protein
MKTVKELLNYLEPEYREKALRNAENYGVLHSQVHAISDAINSFSWSSTPEGPYYWESLYEKYRMLENKELPNA